MTDLLELDDDADLLDEFLARGWGDGLPLVAPTPDRVDAALDDLGWDPDEVIALIPPSWSEATRGSVVVNGVMAGCLPEYLPIVEAALRAMQDERYNLYTVQTTTSPVAPFLLVNGPYARALGMNAATGAMGPGDRVGATVGRAVRMTLVNVGGALPGAGDQATVGLPTKYAWCTREHEEAAPWEPFHVSRGFDADEDAVTVLGAHGPITFCDPGDVPGRQILMAAVDAVNGVGANLFFRPGGQMAILLSPEHAALVAGAGFDRPAVQRFVYDHATQPAGRLRRSGYHELRDWPEDYDRAADDDPIPLVASPDDVLVAVVGGPGRYSHVLPSHGACGRSVTQRIEP